MLFQVSDRSGGGYGASGERGSRGIHDWLVVGAFLGGRFSRRTERPLAAYGAIELLVALGVLLSPVGFALIQPAFVALARLVPGSTVSLSLLRWASAMLVVIVPTTAMGATLPLLARLVEERPDARSRGRALGILYAANTFGGAMGAVGSAYVVLPSLGLRATTLWLRQPVRLWALWQ